MAMSDLDATDPTTANYDAQQLVEEIAAGEEKAPNVDADADYERSKQFDVAEIDRKGQTSKGQTNSGVPKSTVSSTDASTVATGDPDNFLEMAKQVTPTPDEK
jgi:FtsZ-interacting cell division protein YlmF